MSWIAQILPYATLLTVLVGVVFGMITALQYRRTSELSAAVEIVHAMQSLEFSQSIQRIMRLPVPTSAETILEDEELLTAAYVVSHVFEGLAVLVFYRLVPLHLVDRLMGGYARACWDRLRVYVLSQRETLGPMFGEWFEWLTDRLAESPAPGKVAGAHVAHRGWGKVLSQ